MAFHAGTTITLVSVSGTSLAVWPLTAGSWSSGGPTALAGGQTMVIDAGGAANVAGLLGDTVVAVGQGNYQGTVPTQSLS